jgi:signal transduction histidine kinase
MAGPATAPAPGTVATRRPWPLSRMIWAGVACGVVVTLVAVVVAGLALQRQSADRHQVIAVADAAEIQALELNAGIVNQETGVRGYALSAAASFLQPYVSGLAQQQHAAAILRSLLRAVPGGGSKLAAVSGLIADWHRRYASPTIALVRARGKPVISPAIDQGKAEFDAIRAAIAVLETDIARHRAQAVAGLNSAADTLETVIITIGLVLLAIIALFAFAIRRTVARPIAQLAVDARLVAEGDFEHAVRAGGARETQELGVDVDRMRGRIAAELASSRAAEADLQARTQDLQRSNAELEQFAYVASHDLQEPLRKVASFCQLLQRRYAGQLDEKADLYIEYAVDGAKRMQQLVNDLLAFSRVGRVPGDQVEVRSAEALQRAQANLSVQIQQEGAEVESGPLPTVRGESALLATVFQNLLGNALKFRGTDPPRITVSAVRDGAFWEFSVTDNGIGVPPEYAERIFVIFQRLNDRQEYPGTGIGLALCRKIVEYHGGRMWLDTGHSPGTRFCFTLPADPADPADPAGERADADDR